MFCIKNRVERSYCFAWWIVIIIPQQFLSHEQEPPDRPILDSASNLGQLIFRWEINKFKNCWYNSVRILEFLKLLFQQFLNLSSSQRDMSGPILGHLSKDRWSGGSSKVLIKAKGRMDSIHRQKKGIYLLSRYVYNHYLYMEHVWCWNTCSILIMFTAG
jgi:hypothetical protein